MNSDVQFEQQVLKLVAPRLAWGSAEWFDGTLFVEGIMPDAAEAILGDLKKLHSDVRMTQSGSYQADYGFSYDFA